MTAITTFIIVNEFANELPCSYSSTRAAQQSQYKDLYVKNRSVLKLNKYVGVLNKADSFDTDYFDNVMTKFIVYNRTDA